MRRGIHTLVLVTSAAADDDYYDYVASFLVVFRYRRKEIVRRPIYRVCFVCQPPPPIAIISRDACCESPIERGTGRGRGRCR